MKHIALWPIDVTISSCLLQSHLHNTQKIYFIKNTSQYHLLLVEIKNFFIAEIFDD